ncbi:uncharacterized protein LOC115981608 isoform X2 [Quercus lobata]|uniref:uncharacterized protein LOC115981608 isoform X2 n=1 Tax=Quercus lobata TaxID=97700 RepID=UPI001244A326|nr:uncharacterized protein LOC115981608 isoform X2 [Quercus lobata]
MVVASHHVWDAYIKAHPEAQFYRNKALMNYNDLCLIYAHTTGDGRYSLSSHDIDFDDDIQGVNTGVAMNSLVPTSKEHSKTDWTWTNILSSFCWTNLKKAIRSVIHSRNKHGMIPIKKKETSME